MDEKTLDLRALTVVLLQHFGITSGYWNLGVRFGLGAGSFLNPEVGGPLPTGLVQVISVGVQQVTDPKVMNGMTVDASDVTKNMGEESENAPKGVL